jgi:hypothetical protein
MDVKISLGGVLNIEQVEHRRVKHKIPEARWDRSSFIIFGSTSSRFYVRSIDRYLAFDIRMLTDGINIVKVNGVWRNEAPNIDNYTNIRECRDNKKAMADVTRPAPVIIGGLRLGTSSSFTACRYHGNSYHLGCCKR